MKFEKVNDVVLRLHGDVFSAPHVGYRAGPFTLHKKEGRIVLSASGIKMLETTSFSNAKQAAIAFSRLPINWKGSFEEIEKEISDKKLHTVCVAIRKMFEVKKGTDNA